MGSDGGTAAAASVLVDTWRCALPIRVTVAPDSVTSPTPLPPLYVLVPRQSYVSSISAQIWHLVQHVLPKLPGNAQLRPWFDSDGVPLKSTVPVGVLFDLMAASVPSAALGGAGAPSPAGLPWPLTVHYTHPPPETSASWLGSLPPHTQFLNSLKEACHICKGTDGSSAVMRMEGAAQDAMWLAVEKGDAAAYRSALAALKVVPSPRAQGSAPPNIPVRLLLRRPPTANHPPASQGAWDAIVSTSRPIPAVSRGGEWVTLWDALHALVPALVPPPPPKPSQPDVPAAENVGVDGPSSGGAAGEARDGEDEPGEQQGSHGQETGGERANSSGMLTDMSPSDAQAGETSGNSAPIGAAVTPGPALTLPLPVELPCRTQACVEGGLSPVSACSVLVGGVQPPLETPLAWLHAHMHAPDYFLYIVVHANAAPSSA